MSEGNVSETWELFAGKFMSMKYGNTVGVESQTRLKLLFVQVPHSGENHTWDRVKKVVCIALNNPHYSPNIDKITTTKSKRFQGSLK